jgi:hypothetical protein
MDPEDLFAPIAREYARYRPAYPDSLFAYLASVAPGRSLAWDCGTGSGQAAVGLVRHFERVIGTDPSAEQLAEATPHARVEYQRSSAEDGPRVASVPGVDLVTVAQAVHWFSLSSFYERVNEVVRPGGVVAVWCYGLPDITPALDAVIDRFYHDVLGPHWPSGVSAVEAGYARLSFPFDELRAPVFRMEASWDVSELEGFLASWSAVPRYRVTHGSDPLALIEPDLRAAWGSGGARTVSWTIDLRVGRVSGEKSGRSNGPDGAIEPGARSAFDPTP